MSYPVAVADAFKLAQNSLAHSHSPYSGLQVACALKIKNQSEIITGVNVENASYGATICAERSAVVAAVSRWGASIEFEFALVISTFKGEAIAPCGMCLQVLSEFADEQFPIYLGDAKKLTSENKLSDFLPKAFSSQSLPK